MEKNIIVIGSLNYDIILEQDRLPHMGETYAVNDATFCSGGKGANQAVQCAKLGIKTYMVGAVGDDAMGIYLRDTIKHYGVDDTFLKTVEGTTGMGIVNCLQDGSVHANIVRGANYKITKEDIDQLEDLLENCVAMILQLEIPMDMIEYAMDKAELFHVPVIMNAAPQMELKDKYIRKCNFFIANEIESSYYCNKEINNIELAKQEILPFAKKYKMNCIFTLGKDGSVVCDQQEVEYVPSHKVEAIETTGAGDSFVGALGFCLFEEKNIFESARFATCCSALTVCGVGAQDSMPTKEQVFSYIRNTF